LMSRRERICVLPNDQSVVERFIGDQTRAAA